MNNIEEYFICCICDWCLFFCRWYQSRTPKHAIVYLSKWNTYGLFDFCRIIFCFFFFSVLTNRYQAKRMGVDWGDLLFHTIITIEQILRAKLLHTSFETSAGYRTLCSCGKFLCCQKYCVGRGRDLLFGFNPISANSFRETLPLQRFSMIFLSRQ